MEILRLQVFAYGTGWNFLEQVACKEITRHSKKVGHAGKCSRLVKQNNVSSFKTCCFKIKMT